MLTAYTCNQLASLEFMIASILCTGGKGGKPQNLALPLLSLRFLVISFALSGTAVALDVMNVIEVPWLIMIVLNILLQCYYLVKVIVFSSGAAYISKVESKASQHLIKFDRLLAEAKQCIALVTETDQKRMLKRICDAIQYSDPVGRTETAKNEEEIKILLDTLKQKLSEKDGNIEGLCHDLLQAIQVRNDKLHILKMEKR